MILARAITIFVLLACTITHAAPIEEPDIIGTWHIIANLGCMEIVFAADHTYTEVCVGIPAGKQTGTWRIEKGELVKKWTGGTLTFAGESKSADGSETREELRVFEEENLAPQMPREFHPYEHGPLPKGHEKPK